jgi:chemotaxis protein MotB
MLGVFCASLLAAGCVTQGKYDQAVRGADMARGELVRYEQTSERNRTALQNELDEATAIDEQLSQQLAKVGQDSKSLLAANGSLKDALEGSRRRLEELRRAQFAAESRAAVYRELAIKFKDMVDAGDLAISLRRGRMVLRLSNDVLFDSGRSELKPDGKRALTAVAAVLATIAGRHFEVAGHTENEPILVSPYRSNWGLSSARALEVTAFLVGQGVDPHQLSAAGYGEFDPVDANDLAEGRSHNRRTEIFAAAEHRRDRPGSAVVSDRAVPITLRRQRAHDAQSTKGSSNGPSEAGLAGRARGV